MIPYGCTLTVTFAARADEVVGIRPVHAEARDSANGKHIASRQLVDSENGQDAHWRDPRPEEEADHNKEEWPDWAREELENLELATTDQTARQEV